MEGMKMQLKKYYNATVDEVQGVINFRNFLKINLN
jgi:hypothetical protein